MKKNTVVQWNKFNQFYITTLNWERIFLEFEIETDIELTNGDVTFAFTKFKREITNKDEVERYGAVPEIDFVVKETVPIVYDSAEAKYGKTTYIFSQNMAAVNGREFLDNGKWRICAFYSERDEDFVSVVQVTKKLAYELDDLSHIFRYGRDKYAYNLSFSIRNFEGEDLELYFNSYFMITNKKWRKRKYIKEAFTFKGKLKRTYMFAVIWLIRAFYHIFAALTPKNGTRILFMTETKDYIWGNLKYISDRIKERGLDTEFKLSYSCRKSVGNHKNAFSWIKAVYMIAKHDYIFIDDYAPVFGFFKLSKKTTLVQVWHAGEGFKSVGYSRFGKGASPFPSESCHKAYTYALTGSKNLIKVYEEVFGIEKSAFLPTGMARLDDFLNEEKINDFRAKFYKEYPQFEGKKIILFAPTFRGAGQKQAYYDYDKIDLSRIYEFCADEWIFLLKMHPFVDEPIEIPSEYGDRIYDFATYPNINDLYYVTDILITDYSSNYYEYALMQRPVLFYTYDREFYELTRGVHRDVKSHAPGKVCDTFDELMTALENGDFEQEKIAQFVLDNFSERDENAADKAIDEILLKK